MLAVFQMLRSFILVAAVIEQSTHSCYHHCRKLHYTLLLYVINLLSYICVAFRMASQVPGI